MIKVNVRAIVPVDDAYLLMGDTDKDGNEIWDLPGGELKAGEDVKTYLRKTVLANTGYAITNLHFFEIVCSVRQSARGVQPLTQLDFIFTSTPDVTQPQTGLKKTELLPHENFEWLESEGKFRENKVMALLGKYHRKQQAHRTNDAPLALEVKA